MRWKQKGEKAMYNKKTASQPEYNTNERNSTRIELHCRVKRCEK